MNNITKKILFAALAASSVSLSAATSKTYLTPRSTGVNLALEKSAGWHHLIECDDKKRFGFNLQAVGFYNDYNKNQGRYFLVNNKDTIALDNAPLGALSTLGTGLDVDVTTFIHNENSGSFFADNDLSTAKTTLSLDPDQKSYGVTFYYHQDLDKLLKGLYFSVNAPIVHIENDLKLNASSTDAAIASEIKSYFAGENISGGATNQQAPLAYGIINGKDSRTGVADVDVRLGFDFLRLVKKEGFRAALNIGFTIPTSSSSDGKKLFEAREGNQDHWGLGFGGDLDFRIFGNSDHGVKIYSALDYRYLFENAERRTLAIKAITGVDGTGTGKFSHLTLLGKTAPAAGQILVPAANVTTLNVDVTPGSVVDFVAAFAYHNCGFSADLGYNFYFREKESLKAKDKIAEGYGIAARDYATNSAFDLTMVANNLLAIPARGTNNTLSNADLDFDSAATPSQTSHKLYGGVGYVTKQFEIPFLIGLGAHYEWRGQNSALEGWGINGRIGVGF